MEISDGCVCWPSLIRRLSLEWELVSETVSQKDISQKGLLADTQLVLHTHTHAQLIYPFPARGHLPNQVHPSIHARSYKAVYQFDMVLRLWWQFLLLGWLRWWRHRQDGGCHLMWVTGSWDIDLFINFHPGGRWGDSRVHCVQFIPPSACVFISPSLPDDHLSPPYARQSVSTFLSFCPVCPTAFLSFFYLPEWWVDEFHPFIPVAVTASRKTM